MSLLAQQVIANMVYCATSIIQPRNISQGPNPELERVLLTGLETAQMDVPYLSYILHQGGRGGRRDPIHIRSRRLMQPTSGRKSLQGPPRAGCIPTRYRTYKTK